MAAKTGKRAPKRDAVMVHLRMPIDIHVWVEQQARAEFSTKSSKVIRCLAAEMKRETEKA
jgi:hypothetical protein